MSGRGVRVALVLVEITLLLGFVAFVFREDMKSSLVTAQIVADSKKPITHYTIEQSSPGLEFYEKRGYEKAPLPLDHPLEKKQ